MTNNELFSDPAGFRTVKNKPTPDELAKHYDNYLKESSKRPKNYQESYDAKELQLIRLLNDLSFHAIYEARPNWQKPGTMLDVGVGEGFMMARAFSKGWNVKGIDFSSYAAEKFNPKIVKNIDTGNAFTLLETIADSNEKFDVCILHNILEHVIEPRKFLKTVRSILTDESIVTLTVPNDFSLVQMKALELGFIKEEFWVDVPEHLNYFNTSNIQNFMAEMKFNIVDMYSTFPLDFFLFHPGSNYVENEKNGKPVHRARVELELLLSQTGMKNYHKLCRSFASCGVGRNFTALLELQK